jgi:hypothetical protein
MKNSQGREDKLLPGSYSFPRVSQVRLILDERAGPRSHRRYNLLIRPIRGGVNVLLKVRTGAGRELWMTQIRQC